MKKVNIKENKKDGKKGKLSKGKMAAIGAGVAALGAGAYYLLGPDGKKHQKKVKDFAVKTGKKVKKEIEKAKKFAKPIYDEAVDVVSEVASKIKESTEDKESGE